jgi:single-strand DNA-binding protein
MFLNRATLIGYLGGDAEVRTGKNNQKFTTFSIATKTSYKDKESGEYISHTEWHRCIVFGKFGEFAATLKKGAHVQVEGEIRHTEYTPKKAKKPVRTDHPQARPRGKGRCGRAGSRAGDSLGSWG